MSILGVLTDEYFGKIMREEELMRPPKMDSKHPTRDLTTDEMEFLSALAKYTMFFDRSLFFQIEDLRRHTELVLSGEGIMRSEFSHPTELKREIKELKQLIEKLGQEDWDLKRLLEERLEDLTLLNMVPTQQCCWVNISTTMATILRLYFMWIISKQSLEKILLKLCI